MDFSYTQHNVTKTLGSWFFIEHQILQIILTRDEHLPTFVLFCEAQVFVPLESRTSCRLFYNSFSSYTYMAVPRSLFLSLSSLSPCRFLLSLSLFISSPLYSCSFRSVLRGPFAPSLLFSANAECEIRLLVDGLSLTP